MYFELGGCGLRKKYVCEGGGGRVLPGLRVMSVLNRLGVVVSVTGVTWCSAVH